jgi:hypothetical protein
MSIWTTIRGTIEVSIPFASKSCERVKGYLEWVIKDLTRRRIVISGSPSITATPYPHETGGTPWGDAYTRGTINIIGHLDTNCLPEQTRLELSKWLDALMRYVDIKGMCITVQGDMESEPCVYTDVRCYDRIHLTKTEEKELDKSMMFHMASYFQEDVLTPEKVREIADIFTFAGPSTLLTLMNSCCLDYHVKFGFTASQKSIWKKYGIEIPKLDENAVKELHEKLKRSP